MFLFTNLFIGKGAVKKADDSATIYVGNLSFGTDEQTLRKCIFLFFFFLFEFLTFYYLINYICLQFSLSMEKLFVLTSLFGIQQEEGDRTFSFFLFRFQI